MCGHGDPWGDNTSRFPAIAATDFIICEAWIFQVDVVVVLAFEQVAFGGTIQDGILDLTEARANGPGYRLALNGKVSLIERLYRLSGSVQSQTGGAQVPFDVVGPLTDPSVQVNLKAIMDRTVTPSPLFSRQAN